LVPVISALGILPEAAYEPLRTDAIDWFRSFKAGDYVPFCGNLVVEKLQCQNGDYVRVLSNQVPGTALATQN
jgi:hypothetical protein